MWIWGDNGASMEGTLTGTFNELTTLNGIPLTPEEQLGLLFKHGGLEAWGGDQLAPHYAAGWAWAGNAPFDWGKQVASHLGGTRNPLVVHWPGGIADAGAVRSHYTHVNDVGATVLDLAGIPMPRAIDGIEQQPLDGVTFADSFADPSAPERHTQQYYEILGNRGMYKDGWLLASGCNGSRGTSIRRSCARSARAGIRTTSLSSSTTCRTTSHSRRTSRPTIRRR